MLYVILQPEKKLDPKRDTDEEVMALLFDGFAVPKTASHCRSRTYHHRSRPEHGIRVVYPEEGLLS